MINFILASASPRRQELLRLAGLRFTVSLPNINEDLKRGETPAQMVKRLAVEKAKIVSVPVHESTLVLAADTTVVSPQGKNLGKPRDLNEARSMLRALSGKTHRVFTGYALLLYRPNQKPKKVQRLVKTDVTFFKLQKPDVERYLAFNESMDKAGAYAAQGAGMQLVRSVRGSYTNVVGLPLGQVLEDIQKLGVTLESIRISE